MPPRNQRTATSILALRKQKGREAVQDLTDREAVEDSRPPEAKVFRPRRDRPAEAEAPDSTGGEGGEVNQKPRSSQRQSARGLAVAMAVALILLAAAGTGGYFAFSLSAPTKAPAAHDALPETQADLPALWSPSEAKAFSRLPDHRENEEPGLSVRRAAMIRSLRGMDDEQKRAAFVQAEAEALLAGNDPAAYHHAAVLAHMAGERVKAVQYFNKSLLLNPHGTASLFNLAMVEFELGNYDQAADNLARYLQADPSNRIAAYRFVVASILAGRDPPEPPPALAPDSQDLLYARAAIAMHSGRTGEAVELAEAARLLEPQRAVRFEEDMRLLGLPLKSAR